MAMICCLVQLRCTAVMIEVICEIEKVDEMSSHFRVLMEPLKHYNVMNSIELTGNASCMGL
jgi:hypothetical protein